MLSCATFLLVTYIVKKYNMKAVFTISILAACVSGYFPEIGDFLCLSRSIVFLPFFLLGYCLNIPAIERILKSKKVLIMSFSLLSIWILLCWFDTELVYKLRPLFTGRNPFSKLTQPSWGFLYRFIHIAGVCSLMPILLCLATNNKHFFTIAGSRTLQIYVLHRPILYLYNLKFDFNNLLESFFDNWWKVIYIFICIIMTYILSWKVLDIPFKAIFKLEKKIYL